MNAWVISPKRDRVSFHLDSFLIDGQEIREAQIYVQSREIQKRMKVNKRLSLCRYSTLASLRLYGWKLYLLPQQPIGAIALQKLVLDHVQIDAFVLSALLNAMPRMTHLELEACTDEPNLFMPACPSPATGLR